MKYKLRLDRNAGETDTHKGAEIKRQTKRDRERERLKEIERKRETKRDREKEIERKRETKRDREKERD